MWPHRQQPTRLPCPRDSPGKNTGVGCHFLLQCMKVKSESEVAQLCPTLSDPMDFSLPGSSIHGIFQARVLEWGAIAFLGQSPAELVKIQITTQPQAFRFHTVGWSISSVQFSSVAQSCPNSLQPHESQHTRPPCPSPTPRVYQTHVHRVGDAIQPSHPLLSPSPPAPNPSQHQGLFQWVNSLHEMAKVLEFQPQHQSFQWTPRTDLL